jgi:Divergent InlB B-repeat domain
MSGLSGIAFSDTGIPWAWTAQSLGIGTNPKLVASGTTIFGSWISASGVVQGAYANGPNWSSFSNLSSSAVVPNSNKIASNASGVATVVWESTDGVVHASQYNQGGWSADKAISAPGVAAGLPSVVVDVSNNVTVSWVNLAGDVQAVRQVGGNWGVVSTLSSSATIATVGVAPQIAVDANGFVTIAWQEQSGGVGAAQYSYGWGPSTTVSVSSVTSQPLLAIDSTNTPILAWTASGSGVQSSRLLSNAWSMPVTIGSGTAQFLITSSGSYPTLVFSDSSVSQYSQTNGWSSPVAASQSGTLNSAVVDSTGSVTIGYVVVSFRGNSSSYVSRYSSGAWSTPVSIVGYSGATTVSVALTANSGAVAVSGNNYVIYKNGVWSSSSALISQSSNSSYPSYYLGSGLSLISDSTGNVTGLASGSSTQNSSIIDALYGTFNNYQFSLNCNNGGLSTVASRPVGTWCSGEGLYGYPKTSSTFLAAGTVITVSGSTTSSNTGIIYSGSCNNNTYNSNGSCTFTLSGASTVNVDAAYIPTYTLSISASEGGAISYPGLFWNQTCPPSCSITAGIGSTHTLTAIPSNDYTFLGWSGSCSGTGSCVITMTGNQGVAANFALTYPAPNAVLSTQILTGLGTIISSPSGIVCGENCSYTFTKKMSVTLTATPADGQRFNGWSGACTGKKPICKVKLTGNKLVRAKFR